MDLIGKGKNKQEIWFIIETIRKRKRFNIEYEILNMKYLLLMI